MTIRQHDLIIIGAGPFGREVRDMAIGVALAQGERAPWSVAGFLDDRSGLLDGKHAHDVPILGAPSAYQPRAQDRFVCAIGDPRIRRTYATQLRAKGAVFATIIEPSSLIGQGTTIADGCIIGPFCAISCDIVIGCDTVIAAHATLGHDVIIGASCHIGAYAFLGGGVVLGDEVTVHPHASILPGVRVGDGSIIGVGSTVLTDVAPNTTVFGVPARRV